MKKSDEDDVLKKERDKKMNFKMKFCFLTACFMLFQLSANSVMSQKKMEFNYHNIPLKRILNEIKSQTGYSFFYNVNEIDDKQKTSLNADKETIREVLNKLSVKAKFDFDINKNQIILTQKIITLNKSQEREINGTVKEEDGTPLPGANILERGTSNGTQADFDGNFSIKITQEKAVLIVSYIGYATQEVAVDGQTDVTVILKESTAGLDEVVVIGYGSVKKSDLTGSVASIKNEDFNVGAISSVDQALSGNVAGVQINQTNSEPGGGVSVRIRGATSINSGNSPLYVIDGFPINNSATVSSAGGAGTSPNANPKNPLNSLNPNDIISVEILKDASAAAIYGARGANGVILITTKSGSQGKTYVNYDFYTGVQTVSKKMDVLSTSEYINALNDISQDRGESPVFSIENIETIGMGTDWQDEIFRSAVVRNHNLSMGGGINGTNYYVSANYFDQEGVLKNTDMKKYILKANLNQKIGERIDMDLRLNASLINDNVAPIGRGSNAEGGPIYSAVMYDPTLPVYDEDGAFVQSSNLLLNNPVSIIEGISNEVETNRFFGNLRLSYRITDELSTKINFGSDRTNARRDIYNSRVTLSGSASNGIALVTSANDSNILLEYTLNYAKTFSNKNSFNILLGTTYENFVSRGFSASISDFPSDALKTNNLSFGNGDFDDVDSFKSRNSLLSYIGRINYNLLDKFLFTGSLRIDGSSRFGENRKFGNFPSFALAWKLDKETFIPEWFDSLKLRTGWGQIGNQAIGNNNSIATFSSAGAAVFDSSTYAGAAPSRIANPDLKWETTEQYNIGMDFGVMKGRIVGNLDFFVKKTKDMLFQLPLPASSGFSYRLTNLGEMKNQGFEFIIDSRNIVGKDFQWQTVLNFSAVQNEVISLGGLNALIRGDAPRAGNSTIVEPGQPLDSYYGYRVIGIFQDEEEVANSAQPGSQPGFPIYDDVNGDGIITPEDRDILGSPFPDFIFGIKNSFIYKNLELDFFIQGQSGNELLNNNAIEFMYASNFRRNRSKEQILDRWTPQNPGAKWPSATEPNSYGPGKVNSLAVEDASYIRLRAVRLGYQIPMSHSNFIKSLNIYLTGENLVTLTNYSSFNPEANVNGNGNSIIDFNSYPVAKTWSLGCNFKF